MKKILIPTDFSNLGEFAWTVASFLATKTGATIDIISIVNGPNGAYYNNEGDLMNDEGNDFSDWHKNASINEEKMKKWILGKDQINTTLCKIGEIDKTIIQYAEKHEIDLIIMGTEGLFNKGFLSKGSHTEFIANHSPIPVLSLKCDRSDLDLKEMVFVSDFTDNKALNLDIVKGIQKAFGSTLVLLKIITPKNKESEEETKYAMRAFAELNSLENFELNLYNDHSVESGIGKFSAERDIDMIILGTQQSTGFSKLFKKSISDDVVNHLYHPILTFPIK